MEPSINIKELVVIKEENTYNVKDIVTYRDNLNNLVTHRIVSKVDDVIVTRGDNNSLSDDPININKVEGKVCYHSAVLGEIFLYWIKPILAIIILALFFSTVKEIIFSKEKKVDEEK